MINNLSDPRLLNIKRINEAATKNLKGGTCLLQGALLPPPVSIQLVSAGILLDFYGAISGGRSAYSLFKPIVQDHGPWDFKHKIKDYLGKGITLGSHNNIEFSVPGNIHYGFIGSAAGYADLILYLGAGYAEIADPSHNREKAKEIGVEYKPYNGDIINAYGDDPEDYKADQFGVMLYRMYQKGSLSLSRFKTELDKYSSEFSHHEPEQWQVSKNVAAEWPYKTGYFNP